MSKLNDKVIFKDFYLMATEVTRKGLPPFYMVVKVWKKDNSVETVRSCMSEEFAITMLEDEIRKEARK